MKDTEFKAIEPLVETIAEEIDRLFDSAEFTSLRGALRQASELLKDKSVTFNCTLDVFSEERGASLKVLDMGVASYDGREPHRCYGDSTVQRYIVGGEICQVPHDHCPRCWHIWDFKDRHRVCPSCGIELGKEIKILLDSDYCPHCEEGKVTMRSPVCSKCGYEVDLDIVMWG